MKPTRETEASRWLRQAEKDLDDGEYALAGDRYHLACFLAQQSAEKALKSAIYAHGAENVWGHSVAQLCNDLAGLESRWEGLKRRVAFLDRFYIATRYPSGLPGGIPAEAFRRQDAEEALAAVRALLDDLRPASD